MAQESNVNIKVRLGVLAHADVAQPGRRLVWRNTRGWVAEPVRRRGLAGVVWFGLAAAAVAAVVPLVVWLLHARMPAPPPALALSAVQGAAASAPDRAMAHTPSPPEVPPGFASRASVPGASIPPRGEPSAPRPPWAATSDAIPAAVAVVPAQVLPAAGGHTGVALAARRPARPTRRIGREPATPATPAIPASQTPPTDDLVAGPHRSDVLVAITGTGSIVVPDPKGLPAAFRVGERLPSGARLLKVDPRRGEAETDRGVIRLE